MSVDLFGNPIPAPVVRERVRRPLKIRPFDSRRLTLADRVGFTIRDSKDTIAAHVRRVAGKFILQVGPNTLGSYDTLAEAENAGRLAIEEASKPKPRGPKR